jgi:hypothetical protein
MARLLTALFCLLVGACAGNDEPRTDNGYVWLDANTKMRIAPIGSAASGATRPGEYRKTVKPSN